ncbi:MAG: hypothetical protein R2941_23010 [Desulfobacterales bacterium]
MLTVEDGYRRAMAGTIGLYDNEGKRLHTIYAAAAPECGKQTFLNKMEEEISQVKKLFILIRNMPDLQTEQKIIGLFWKDIHPCR